METFATPFGPFSCYKNDQNFYYHLTHNSYWEIELIFIKLQEYWKKAEVILDIGAHIGSHSFIYSFVNRKAMVYTFEPQKEIFNLLVKNLESRGNVKNHNVCVGHMNGFVHLSKHSHLGENATVPLCYGEGPSMNLGGVSLGSDGESVEMITIDSLNLEKCDYMKIDVEGAEPLVFMGAAETIQRFKPIICFEYDTQVDSSGIAQMFGFEKLPSPMELLKSYGYEDIRQVEGSNWVALPKVGDTA